jgi:hypothetical protein
MHEELAGMGFPREMMTECLWLAGFDVGLAALYLGDPDLKKGKEKAFLNDRPFTIRRRAGSRAILV